MEKKRIRTAIFVLLFIVGFLSYGSEAPAQSNGRMTGKITDQTTGDPLPGANIYLTGTAIGAASNLNGEYKIDAIPPGRYTLRATFIGYKQKDAEIRVRPGETLVMNIELEYDVVEGETVTITAQAEGQLAAINQQLRSNTITNVVSSERIQEFPDANAAESVGRLPGVSIRRSGGEGNKIVIRGLSPQYNTITIGGEHIPSTDLNDRSVDLNMIAPEILSGIELTKALTPDKDADTFGGTVDFKLANARAGGFYTNFRLRGGYNSHREDFGNYKGSMTVSDRLWDEKLGLLVTGNMERAQRGNDRLNASYIMLREKREGEEFAPITIQRLQLQHINEVRKRLGFNLLLDYQFEQGKIGLSNFFSRLDRKGVRNVNEYDLETSRHDYEVSDPQQQIDVMSNSLTGEHTFFLGDIDWRLSRTASVTRELINLYDNNELSAFDFSDMPSQIGPEYLVSISNNDLQNTVLRSGDFRTERSFERDLSSQLNLKIPFAPTRNISGFIKLGGKYREKLREREQTQNKGWLRTTSHYSRFHTRINDPDFVYVTKQSTGEAGMLNYIDPDFDPGNFLNGEYDFPIGLDIDEFNHFKEIWALDSLYNYFGESRLKDYETVETVAAGYAMAEINFGRYIMFLPGVRYENTHSDMTGRRGTVKGDLWEDSFDQPSIKDTTATNEYSSWFPMFHLRVRPTGWFNIRLAYTKSQVHPRLSWMLPNEIINQTAKTVTLGNPILKPQKATNYDAFLSLYSNKIGLFTLGVFYKEIDDLIFERSGHVVLDPEKEGLKKEVKGYVLDRPENNTYMTSVRGFEIEWQTNLHWLPRPFNGVVLNVNYSHAWSSTRYPRSFVQRENIPVFPYVVVTVIDTSRSGRMIDQANDLANISLGYDLGPFSARISMLYQGQTLSAIGERPEQDEFTVDLLRWDLTFKYNVTRNLELFFNFNNVTNEPDQSFRFDSIYPTSKEYYGWTTDFGIGYQF